MLALYVSQLAALSAQSALFPRLIAFPLAALTFVSLAVQTLPPLRALRDPAERTDRLDLRRLAIGPVLTLLYLVLWEPLGFQLDTVLFLIVAPALLGYRRGLVLVAVAFGIAILFAYLFHLGSGAILPAGILHVEWP